MKLSVSKSIFIALMMVLIFLTFCPPLASSNIDSMQNSPPLVMNLDIGSTVENSCVLYLNLDETTGENIYDSSGKNNHGTLINFNFNENDGWVEGVRGSALKFDGQNDYILVQSSDSLNPDYITLEAWVYAEFPKSNMVLHKDGVLHFSVDSAGHVGFYVVVNGTVYGSWSFAPMSLEAGKWHHIVATYDGLYMRAYANGVLVKTSPYIPGTLDSSTSPLSIGADVFRGIGHFRGIIDEVRIYNRALDDKDIWQHYSTRMEDYIDLAPLISWSYYDPDGDHQVRSQIQVGVNENDNSLWDYVEDSSSTWVKYNGVPLSTDVTYYLRIRAYDGSAWSDWTSKTFNIIRQPRFELSNAIIEPKEVNAGGTVYISVDVTNVGEGSGSYPVVLTIDGVETDTKVVTLNPGESERVTFAVVVEGKYNVDIGGMLGNFEVVSFSPALYNFIIATLIAAILTMIAIFVKSKLKSK
ncbi:MAG: LamG-like jellyroll fold domain-containing protein [Promethearchaeota archaeon]